MNIMHAYRHRYSISGYVYSSYREPENKRDREILCLSIPGLFTIDINNFHCVYATYTHNESM